MNNSMKFFGVIFGYLVSIYFLLLFFKGFDLTGILEEAQLSRNLDNYFFAMIVFLLSLYIRSLRWEAMVYGQILPRSTLSRKTYLTYLVSDGLNNILPFRIGDFYRIMITKVDSNLSITKLLILLVLERVLDLFILLVFGLITIFFIKNNDVFLLNFFSLIDWIFEKSYLFIIAFSVILFSIILISKFKSINSRLIRLFFIISEIKVPVFRIIILTFLTWFLEFIVFFVVFNILLIKIDILEMFVVFVSSTLSTLIPSAPGYVGTFHFFSSQTLDLFNVNNSTAGFFAIIIHLIIILPTVLLAIFYLNVGLFKVIKKGLKIKYE